MAQSNLNIAYLQQVPGGVWRATEMQQPSYVSLTRAVKYAIPLIGRKAIAQRLNQMGTDCLYNLRETQYKTFYKFLKQV